MRAAKLGFALVFAAAAIVCLWVDAHLLLHGLPAIFLAGPFAFAAAFGTATWSQLTGSRYARRACIPASVLLVLLSLFVITYLHPAHLVVPLWAACALGYAGLALFGRTQSPKPTPRKAPGPASLPGDGTTAAIGRLAAVAAAVAAVAGTAHWSRWALAHGLPLQQSPILYVQYLFTVLFVLFVHEGGHALAGVLLRMKLVTFIVGPFRWRRYEGHWQFEFRPLDLVAFLGAAAVVPADMRHFRIRKLLQVAAGPVASLVTGVLAVAAILHAPGHAWAGEWRVLAYFATISLVVAFLNFIPFKLGSGYSDGAKLYQLSQPGLWSDYHRLLAAIHATHVTPLRPRDYDVVTAQRAAGTIACGPDELNMHLCACAHYLDSGQLAPARAALEKAEALCHSASLEPPDHYYSDFVFAIAYLRRDSAAARLWWDRMQSRDAERKSRPRQSSNQSRLASSCALLLTEGRTAEAAEVWQKANAWASNLPDAGASAVQRHRIHLLGLALNERLATTHP